MFEECIKMIDDRVNTLVFRHQTDPERSIEYEVACLADFVSDKFGAKNLAKLCDTLLAEKDQSEKKGDPFKAQAMYESWRFTSALYRAHLRGSFSEDTQKVSDVWESLRKEATRGGFTLGSLFHAGGLMNNHIGIGNFLLPFMLNPLVELTLHMDHELAIIIRFRLENGIDG
jgi:hypothetical protein